MEPKGGKKTTLKPYRFCVTLLITFGIILAPKVVLFEPYFGSKTDLFPKVVILSKYCTGHTDSRFRPLKKEPNLTQKRQKSMPKPGTQKSHQKERFGLHFGSHFGSSWRSKCCPKPVQKLSVFSGIPGGDPPSGGRAA